MDKLASQVLVGAMLCIGLFVITGCTTRLGDFTVLSSKNVDVSGLKPGDRFTAEDCINYAFNMIPLGESHWKNAMDRATEQGKGDVMVDIVFTASRWGFPLIWGQLCVIAEGNVAQSAAYKR